jgi:hypothetical protein
MILEFEVEAKNNSSKFTLTAREPRVVGSDQNIPLSLAREVPAVIVMAYPPCRSTGPGGGVEIPGALFVANHLVGPALCRCLTRFVAYKDLV